jgi:ATP-dependent Clp protease ATP-binding subunit ClpA
LDKAFSEAEQMKDEYVSLEHILLSVSGEKEGKAAMVLNAAGITRDSIFKALVDIRGGQMITDPNPEDKYQALERFSIDLTAMASKGDLDPVIGREDEIIFFNSLGQAEIAKIVDIQFRLLQKRLEAQKIKLKLTNNAQEFIATIGFDQHYGVRPLKRTIQRLIQDPLAVKILEGSVKEHDQVWVDVCGGEIVFNKLSTVEHAAAVS